MKCIHCNSDTTFPVRRGNGGRCGSCRHLFAFEPKTDPLRVSDGLFNKIIKDVSGDGKLFYTEKQLWYEFNRKTAKKKIGCGASMILWMLLLPAAHSLSIKHASALVAFALVAVATSAVAKQPAKPKPPVYAPVSLAKFRGDYLAKWTAAHGVPDHMQAPPTRSQTGVSFGGSGDLTSFSFDRVLVTQDAETAAMLVANNFHFENNCAILSMDGYPYDRFDTVLQMLGRNPQLIVFALHDASYQGAELGALMRDSRWFPDPTIRIIDLGIRPIHAQKANMILLKVDAAQLKPTTRSSLSAEELTWLAAGNVAEVANVRPAKLMRAIFQGFARAGQVSTDGSSVYDDGGVMIWVYDPGVDIYATESFG